jgi:hypothetical protein
MMMTRVERVAESDGANSARQHQTFSLAFTQTNGRPPGRLNVYQTFTKRRLGAEDGRLGVETAPVYVWGKRIEALVYAFTPFTKRLPNV